MWTRVVPLVLFAGFSLAQFTTKQPSLGAGCGQICCHGRNNSCISNGFKIDGKGSSEGHCYCDEGCLDMGDCCFDYHTACTAVDCEMSEWSDYSECSEQCRTGLATRTREILVRPRFGGRACPLKLRESSVCQGTNCVEKKEDPVVSIEKETAKIMPARFGRYRAMKQYNANMDIRKNLYDKYYSENAQNYTGYCSRFRVVSSRSGCLGYYTSWANVLRQGAVICVQCQGTAMEKENSKGMCAGHGEVGVNTNWQAINARGCQGWWERLEDVEECSCRSTHDFIFI